MAHYACGIRLRINIVKSCSHTINRIFKNIFNQTVDKIYLMINTQRITPSCQQADGILIYNEGENDAYRLRKIFEKTQNRSQ